MTRVVSGMCALAAAIVAAAAVEVLAQAPAPPPLSIARQGYLFTGGKYETVGERLVMTGHLYAEFQIPSPQKHPWPIVMIHGGGQSGTNFTGTPDGREGWAQFFLRQGYAVYVIDQPGRGRAAYEAETYGPATQLNAENTQRRFVAPARYNLWPQAHLHTQWPGDGKPGDPAFDQFFASQLPAIRDFRLQQRLNRDALLALLQQIGPAILLTHSQGGTFGWPVADARPDLVKAILAVEPNGPPFFGVRNVPAPEWFRDGESSTNVWGVTAVPLAYAPPAAEPSDLSIERQETPDGPGLVRCWLQKAAARQLPNLAKVPILVLTGEASYHAPYDHCTVKYLQQAGVAVLDVNYGGSSGYGRAYRERLNGRWGIVDVADVINAARFLAGLGPRDEVSGNAAKGSDGPSRDRKADTRRLIIRGGSAGGYTTLAALTFHPEAFKAGASYYGISDLEALEVDTHKFESRYSISLIGPYPERKDVYRARSPIHFVDRLACPLILFQGLEDKVVPPNQSQMMADAVRAKGLPVAYLAFEGEQHGFRKAETIIRCLEAELYFYGAVFGFAPADAPQPVHIDNL